MQCFSLVQIKLCWIQYIIQSQKPHEVLFQKRGKTGKGEDGGEGEYDEEKVGGGF